MEGKVKNSRLFVFLAILLIVILAMFVYFIISYAKMDKNVYEVDVGSVLYTDSLKYIKIGFELVFLDECKIELKNNHYKCWRKKEEQGCHRHSGFYCGYSCACSILVLNKPFQWFQKNG